MKLKNIIFITLACAFGWSSCQFSDNKKEEEKEEEKEKNFPADQIICHATYTDDSFIVDSVFFTQTDILYFDVTTNELKLKNLPTMDEMLNFNNFVFYIDGDALFTASLALDYMSTVINDLVLRYNSQDGNLYLEDGYPMWMNNASFTTLRNQNKEKRAANWSRFIEHLRQQQKLAGQ